LIKIYRSKHRPSESGPMRIIVDLRWNFHQEKVQQKKFWWSNPLTASSKWISSDHSVSALNVGRF